MTTELLLGALALITSLIAAVVGFGGGMVLLAVMPHFFAPAQVIPAHAVTQMASNASRLLFSFGDVRWSFFAPFFLGSLVGLVLFGLLLFNMPTRYLPLGIGIYILLKLWCRRFIRLLERYENLYLIGFLQTGLGTLVGSTGPLALSYLGDRLDDKNQIIATSALFVSFSHLAKIPMFTVAGVSLWACRSTVLVMVAGSVVGSWLGTCIRWRIDNERLLLLVKCLLTALALNMIVRTLLVQPGV